MTRNHSYSTTTPNNPTMKKYYYLLILLLCTTFCSCIPDVDPNPFLGTWTGGYSDVVDDVPCDVDLTFTFYDDMTADMESIIYVKKISGYFRQDVDYTYSYDDANLYLKEAAGTHIYRYSFDGDQLILVGAPGTTPETFVLKRDI